MHVTLYSLNKIVFLQPDPGAAAIAAPGIETHAWGSSDDGSVLAICVDSGCILLRYQQRNRDPRHAQFAWPPEEGTVSAMCFDSSGTWLLCVTSLCNIVIVPALAAMGYVPSEDWPWSLTDITRFEWDKMYRSATCVAWWTMLSGEHVALIGTKVKSLLFVELRTGQMLFEKPLSGLPETVNIFKEGRKIYAVVFNSNGQSNKFLVEQEIDVERPLTLQRENSVISIPTAAGIGNNNLVSCQRAWGQELVAALFPEEQILRVYDSLDSLTAMYEYCVPVGTQQVLLTDQTIFCVTPAGLVVLSNQAALITYQDQQTLPADLQQFTLPDGEHIETLVPLPLPTSSSSSSDVDPEEWEYPKTVLQGCLVFTRHSVYECVMSHSPEDIYLELILEEPLGQPAEDFHQMLNISSQSLHQEAAVQLLKKGADTDIIKTYFDRAKTPDWKQAIQFAEKGYTEVAQNLSVLLWETPGDIPENHRAEIASLKVNLMLKCAATGESDNLIGLRMFLLENTWYNPDQVFVSLARHGQHILMIEVAKMLGLLPECVDALLHCTEMNAEHDTAGAIKGLELLFEVFTPSDIVSCFEVRHELLTEFTSIVQPILQDMEIELLKKIATLLNPSHVFYCRLYYLETREINSFLESSMSGVYQAMPWGTTTSIHSPLLQLYVLTVVHILAKDRDNSYSVMFGTGSVKQAEKGLQSDDLYMKFTNHDTDSVSIVTSGRQHVAAIVDGHLYLWGRHGHGSLGFGHQHPDSCQVSPLRMESLLHMKVTHVSCGSQHTLALTEQGLYSWGSSHLGQTGHGHRYRVLRPLRLADPEDDSWTGIDCGQYHSLAITRQGSVYSWGWGVYGQLGCGTVEDQLCPALVIYLQGLRITQAAGGYAHSLFLTDQGEVYSCGLGKYGQLGYDTALKVTIPQKIPELQGSTIMLATGYFTNLALTSGGKLVKWGSHPRDIASNKMNPQVALESVNISVMGWDVKQVAAGEYFCAAMVYGGEVYTWGVNYEGQLGNGNRQEQRLPTLVTGMSNSSVRVMSCGANFMVVMDSEGRIWAWGANSYGQCGCLPRSIGPDGYTSSTRAAVSSMQQSFVRPQPVIIPEAAELHLSEDVQMLQTLHLPNDDPDTILFLCKVCHKQIDMDQVTATCEKLSQWDIAADIMLAQQQFSKACSYMMKACSSREKGSRLADSVTELLSVLFRSVHSTCYETSEEFKEAEGIFCQLFDFWENNQLPVDQLQNFLLQQTETYLYPICTVLFWSEQYRNMRFTPDFQIEVTEKVTRRLDMDDSKEAQLFGLKCIQATNILEVSPKKHQEEKEEKPIALSHEELCDLLSVDANSENLSLSDKENCLLAVFKCGHHFTSHVFYEQLLPAFQQQCQVCKVPTDAAALAVKVYSDLSDCDLPCPSCMFALLRE